ncbi:MAG: beta-ketoacyl-ACP synthase III [Legionella sp.]
MKHALISGSGSYLPEQLVSNIDLESKLDTTHEWIFSRTGICNRHIAAEHETTSFMAGQAAYQAVQAAGLTSDEIDLILVATCTPDHFFPSVACHVQRALQMTRSIPAFDISAACSGFVYALDIARQYIHSEAAKHVLVVGSESMSRAVNWSDRSTCILFGDGAGALVISASDRPGIVSSVIHSSFDQDGFLNYPTDGKDGHKSLVSMRGNEVFKLAVTIMGDVVDEVLTLANLKQSDIDWLVPHQANIRIIKAIAKKLALPMSQVILTIENQGNTSAASIPLALDVSIREQKIKRGDLLLLESFGGGMTWGAMLVRY